MLLHSLSLDEWLAALIKAKAVPDRAAKNFTTRYAEENREAKNN